MKRTQRIIFWSVMAAIGLSAWVIGVFNDPHRAWIGVLGGFTFFTPLTSGLVTWSAIVKVSQGSWPEKLERIPLSAIGCMVPTSLLLIVLWIGSPFWGPWDIQHLHETHGIWFDPAFLFTRDLVALLILWFVALRYHHRRIHSPARKYASWLIITYCFVITIIAFDLVMGLRPGWNSSVFGAYMFITGLYAAVAVWTMCAIFSGYSLGPENEIDTTEQFSSKSRLHDLGKLVFAFAILSSYLLFCQLLPIWYENLPSETTFLIPLMNFGLWDYVSLALLAIVFVGPILYLLPIKVKRTPWILGLACSVIIGGLWIERLWLILPTFKINSLAIVDFGVLFALTGICAISMEIADRLLPESFPKEDSHG